MKLKVIWTGKNNSAELANECEKFISRIRHFIPIEIIQLKDPRITDEKKRIEAESRRILATLDQSIFTIVMDPAGETYDSVNFSKFLDKHLREDPRDIAFVLGGYGGLTVSVKQRSDKLLSLSKLTFSHDLSRLILLEQLYRAFAIIRNHPYAR